jgi:acyl-CoA reductase-like NAD-dependent aldehyde dehydrogenase
MGLVEVEIGAAITAIVKKPPAEIESLLRRMALIIDKQSMAIKQIRWSEETKKATEGLDEWLFQEIQEIQKCAKE